MMLARALRALVYGDTAMVKTAKPAPGKSVKTSVARQPKPARNVSAKSAQKSKPTAPPAAPADRAVEGDIAWQNRFQQNLLTLYTAIEQSPISVVIADADANIQYVNPYFTKITGYSAEEVIGKNPRIFQSGLTRNEIYADLWNALNKGEVWHGEFINRRKNGDLYWEEAHIAPIKDTSGNACQYVCMKLDVTRRKQVETELLDKHNLLTSVINSSTDFIFVKDAGLRTVLCNEAFAGALGKRPAELYGKTDIENGWPTELVKGNPEKGIKGYEQDDLAALSGETVRNMHDPAPAGGEIRIFDTVKLPVIGASGSVIGLLGIGRDISDRLADERLTRSLLLQARTLTRHMFDIQEDERRKISRELHDELGQWLTAIQAETQAIENIAGKTAPEMLGSIRAVKRSAESMHEVIRRIVHSLRPALLDTLGLADSLRELEKQWCQPRLGISCEFWLEGDLANLGDELNITIFRVVQEALNNIASYAQANHVSVHLRRVLGAAAGDDAILLSIGDDGVGFDAGQKLRGTGLLGMRERVIAAGGEFDLNSAPGQGVRIHIKLPVAPTWEEDYERW
ncbi:MAG: multi-sensor signal transduction histidine kinase [Gallionellaceae bacterium]|nr:MAG: multi-sensor signal transduction histidine kinase [Gallionellaceae bacterium]